MHYKYDALMNRIKSQLVRHEVLRFHSLQFGGLNRPSQDSS